MAKKTLYFDSFGGYHCAAVMEENKLIEYFIERDEQGSIVGNIYKGRVCDVLNGMQAAFINCGLERNCYISVEDLFPDRAKYDGAEIDIPDALNLNVGDEILVQVVKPPVGKKGAKVTTHISLVGNSAIYLPNTEFYGISRKIADQELRKNLLFAAKADLRRGEGIIIRTAAPYSTQKQKSQELNYLRNRYHQIKEEFRAAPVGALLYRDSSLTLRVLRDTLPSDVESILAGNDETLAVVEQFMALHPMGARRPVKAYHGQGDMFYELGIMQQMESLMSPRVPLDNGAYLIIEKTEALTVIDVNTGKFIGDDSLEQTVYSTNIMAAREIARQVRLRNIGGIVVVDFIDMGEAAHRNALAEELEKALASDRAKCTVAPVSKFGLIEFTRKRIGTNPVTFMTKPCKYCQGEGIGKSTELLILDIRAQLLSSLAQGNGVVTVDVNNDVGEALLANEAMIGDIRSRFPDARVYLILHRTYPEEKLIFRTQRGTFSLPEGYVQLY